MDLAAWTMVVIAILMVGVIAILWGRARHGGRPSGHQSNSNGAPLP
jgi:hypothetical protein